jgi:hypothetical protein
MRRPSSCSSPWGAYCQQPLVFFYTVYDIGIQLGDSQLAAGGDIVFLGYANLFDLPQAAYFKLDRLDNVQIDIFAGYLLSQSLRD